MHLMGEPVAPRDLPSRLESSALVEIELDSTNVQSAPSPSEHYKIVIEDTHYLANRRETVNSLFVSAVSLIAGGEGYILITLTGTATGLIVMIAATIFGIGLCRIWQNSLRSYKVLLAFRYATLKVWEKNCFPSPQQYYITEDMLYVETKAKKRDKTEQPPPYLPNPTQTDLAKGVIAVNNDIVGSARVFGDMYKSLPMLARWVLVGLAALQLLAFLANVLGPHIPPHLLPHVF